MRSIDKRIELTLDEKMAKPVEDVEEELKEWLWLDAHNYISETSTELRRLF